MPPSSRRSPNRRQVPYPISPGPPADLDEEERASWYELREISQRSGGSWPEDARASLPQLMRSMKKTSSVRERGISRHIAYRQIMAAQGTWAHVVVLRVLFKDAFRRCEPLHRVLTRLYPGAPEDFQVDKWQDEYHETPDGLPMNNDAFQARPVAEDEDDDYSSSEEDDDYDSVVSIEDEDELEQPTAVASHEQSLPLVHRPAPNTSTLPQASSGSAHERDIEGLATPTRQRGSPSAVNDSDSDDDVPPQQLRTQRSFQTPQRPQGIARRDGLADQGIPASAPGRLPGRASLRNTSPQTPSRAPTLSANAAAARNRAAAYFRDAGDRELKAGENYRMAAENELRAAELWELAEREGA